MSVFVQLTRHSESEIQLKEKNKFDYLSALGIFIVHEFEVFALW